MLGREFDVTHLKYPAVQQAFEKANINQTTNNQDAQILWWDGDIKNKDFDNVGPAQRINKIPGMDYICFKSTTIHAMNQMKRLFPNLYTFIPQSFLLPHQFGDLQRLHNKIQTRTHKPVTWIVKPRNECCGHGIHLIQHLYELQNKTEPIVVQRYVSPFLLDGYKFDFRFYILISSLAPYTAYLYKEGLARFCTHKYAEPNISNLNDKFATLTNTSVNVENQNASVNFTRLASEVLTEIKESDHRGAALWGKICDVSRYSILAIWPQIVSSINQYLTERRFYRKPTSSISLDSYSKYFHILGIDIMINECCNPVFLELNDRPSMVVTFDCERELKRDLIYDALTCLTPDGSPINPEAVSPNWEKLLPVSPGSPSAQSVDEIIMQTASIFRTTAANRERPHYEERIVLKEPTFKEAICQ